MTYTLKNPTVEAVYVNKIRDGDKKSIPDWFMKLMFSGVIYVHADQPGNFRIRGEARIAGNEDVIILHPDKSLTIMDANSFWRLYDELPGVKE